MIQVQHIIGASTDPDRRRLGTISVLHIIISLLLLFTFKAKSAAPAVQDFGAKFLKLKPFIAQFSIKATKSKVQW